jgi:RHS repeat-associated protein
MDIYVDGSKIATLNSYNANLLWQQSWNSPVFTDSTHTVQFVNVSAIVDVDAITVYRTGPSVLSSYTYADTSHDHAVTSVAHTGGSTDTYQYDANGNMTCRVESGKVYVQTYNAENRMAGAMQVSGTCASWGTILATWTFTYDGDGSRVKQEYTDSNGTLTTYYFMGGAYEKRTAGTTTTTIKYYSFGGQTIMNDGTGLKYFLTDHLGSVVAITNASGALVSQQRYLPFGQVRTDIGTISQTDLGYTGQRNLDAQGGAFALGLMDYRARFYSQSLGRFVQPDTITPGGPQGLNRYSYANNNPLL